MERLESESVQVGESEETLRKRVANSTRIYATRRDCHSLKSRLLALVGDGDYWDTLACFLHGQCSKQTFDETMRRCLPTPEAKLLHNELVRSILFNAHFAMSAPPNVDVPHPDCPALAKRSPATAPGPPARPFATMTASDLRHLPSLNQLAERIGILLDLRKVRVESRATGLIFAHLKKYVMTILENSVALLSVTGGRDRKGMRITTAQILHVMMSNAELASTVSPAIFAKYSGLLA
jgi:hypothetical protein